MRKSFKHLLWFLLLALTLTSLLTVGIFAEDVKVAKIGDTGYATLQAAMDEANKAAGDYTITLLKDSAEVFTFAQKSGVNITIDGDGNTFSANGVAYEDMTWFVGNSGYATDAEAQNGGKFGDLAAIVADAEAGDTVILLDDIALSEMITIPAGKTVTLDLNGKTISQEKACTASYSMIENNGTLTITGNGKISFTDTGAGDAAATWGAYTIRNSGTLIVENGTIENLSAQNVAGQAFAHTILAIFQYSGSTTINGGTISTPNYRSILLWSGDVTINGGTFEGQFWCIV